MTAAAMANINETEARLNSHEAVCQLRYEAINARLKRIEQILMASAAFIIATLGAIALKLPH
jgi:hypothetical protein